MDPLIAALSGIGASITALTGVLWRAQLRNGRNGRHQDEELASLREIGMKLQILVTKQDAMNTAFVESQNHVADAVSKLASALEYMRGRMDA